MSSWREKGGRDGASLLALAAAVVLANLLVPAAVVAGPVTRSPGPKPFLWALQGLDRVLPALPARGSGVTAIGLVLLVVAVIALFYCVWRTSRNRIVSLGAAFLVGVHPLARAALREPAALGDLADLALLASALAIAAGPRRRSSRFPNRPPRPATRPLLAVFALALLTSPQSAFIPAIVVLYDLFFQREADRAALERDWRGYAPHLLFLGLGGLLENVPRLLGLAAKAPGLGLGHGERLVAVFWPAHPDSTWLLILAAGFMLGAALIGAVELLFTLGRRRTTLPWIGFAGGLLLLEWFLDVPHDGLFGQKVLRAFIGVAMLLPVLAWRVVVRLLPPAGAAGALPAGGPGWDARLAQVGLQPLPDLAGLPAPPRLADWEREGEGLRIDWQPLAAPAETLERPVAWSPELEAALKRIGREAAGLDAPRAAFDAAFAAERLAPRLDAGTAALLLLPSESPYAAFVAERAGEVILVEQVEGPRPGFPELAGLDNLRLFEQDGRRPWPSRDGSIDLVLVAGVAEKLPARQLESLFVEAGRVLAPAGRLFLVYPIFERAAADSNALPLATLEGFIELAGLRLVARRDSAERHVFEIARRESR